MIRRATAERMKGHVDQLVRRFGKYLQVFSRESPFTGPSTYFHCETLRRRSHRALSDVLEDDLFFDYLYATLSSWGLHRMGRGPTTLGHIEEMKRSFQNLKEEVLSLGHFEIDSIPEGHVSSVASDLWKVLSSLAVGVGKTKLVASSKALHHFLPDLMPPIDRRYTLPFFYGYKIGISPSNEEGVFKQIYPYFREIGCRCARKITEHIGRHRRVHDMNTSKTKVIDNAIVGFILHEG